jgi:hypothetical protein
MANILQNLVSQHSGKWYEVVVYCKNQDDGGEIVAKFTSPTNALWFANKILETSNGLYTLIIVR